MTKLQILAAQIQTDLNGLIEGVSHGSVSAEEILKEIVMVNEKVKDWSKEADKLLNEAKAINTAAEEHTK